MIRNDDKPSLVPLLERLAGRDAAPHARRRLLDRRTIRRRRRPLRRADRARRRRPDGVHAARADRLRRALLRTASSRRRAARRAACRSTTCCARSTRVAAAGFKEIALTGVHLGSYGRDLTPASSLIELLRALGDVAGVPTREPSVLLSASARSSRWTARARSSIWSPRRRRSRRIFICRCSTRATACSRRCAGRTRSTQYARAGRRHPRADAARVDRLGHHRRLSRRDATRTSRSWRRICAKSPLTHLHVFPYSDRPGTAASAMARQGAGRGRSRARARASARSAQRLTQRVPRAQVGHGRTARSRSTMASLVVTGNYLKLKIAPGCARNEWVTVRATRASRRVSVTWSVAGR